jgi:hypothetical protein
MKRVRSLVLASTLATVALLASAPVRADIPPTCDMETSLITCAAADVGKPCQGAGQCYAVSCLATTPSTTTTTLYKCDACPTVLATSSVTCSTTNVGAACGTGATCMVLSAWCAAAGGSKYVCAIPAAAQPTGPPTGETGAAGGGGASSSGAAGGGGANVSGTAGGGGSSASSTGSGGGPGPKPLPGSGGGGCAVGAGAETTAGIAVGLVAIGLGFLSLSRRRRAR